MHTNICNLICASVFGAAASASLLTGAANTYMCVYNRERELDTIFSADLGRDEPLEMLYRLDKELKEILFLGYENFFSFYIGVNVSERLSNVSFELRVVVENRHLF